MCVCEYMCMEFGVENLRRCQSLCSRHCLVVETWIVKQTIKQTYKLLTETTFCSSQSLNMTTHTIDNIYSHAIRGGHDGSRSVVPVRTTRGVSPPPTHPQKATN